MQPLDADTLGLLWHDADLRDVRLREIVTRRLEENPPPRMDDQVVATYFFALRTMTLSKAVGEIAYHATSGVKHPPPGSLLDQCTAKAAGVDALDAGGRIGLLHVAFPLKMLLQPDGHLTSCDLLHTMAGAIVFDVYENQDSRLVALQIPEPVLRTFPGPAYGPQGLRERTRFGPDEPAFGTILPRDNIDEDNKILNVNNTGLRPQYSNNFDATVEYYFEPVGQFSVGVFLKEISDFIYNTTGTIIGSGPDNGFNGEYEGFELRSRANGGFARIRGWEANYRQQFTFLPGWLGGFGALANYTWLETEGDYGGAAVQTTGTLANFTPRAANVGISYIRGKFNIRLTYGMVGETLLAYNAQQHLRRYRLQGNRIELKTRYPIARGIDVYVDVYNLTNDKLRDVFGVPDRPRSILDRNDPQIHFGFNGRF